MKLYADLGARRAGQVVGDLLVAVWVLFWATVGVVVHGSVAALGVVGEGLEDGGGDLAGSLEEAGRRAAEVPLVGDGLRAPFDQASGAAAAVAEAGRSQQEAVSHLAVSLGLVASLVPIALVLLVWVPRRMAYARRAGATLRHLDTAADLDLLALRALSSQPMDRLGEVDGDPLRAWRDGDPEAVRRLAALEMRGLGLRLPARLRASPLP